MEGLCEVRCVHPEAIQRARERLDSAPVGDLAESFRVLGDPTRLGMLVALGGGELCVCDLAELFGVTPGAISHQLRLLKAHRLVRARRVGKLVYYSLDDAHVTKLLDQGLEHAREAKSGTSR